MSDRSPGIGAILDLLFPIFSPLISIIHELKICFCPKHKPKLLFCLAFLQFPFAPSKKKKKFKEHENRYHYTHIYIIMYLRTKKKKYDDDIIEFK